MVVVVFPVADDETGMRRQGPEAADVEAFVADTGVERFDAAVASKNLTSVGPTDGRDSRADSIGLH